MPCIWQYQLTNPSSFTNIYANLALTYLDTNSKKYLVLKKLKHVSIA